MTDPQDLAHKKKRSCTISSATERESTYRVTKAHSPGAKARKRHSNAVSSPWRRRSIHSGFTLWRKRNTLTIEQSVTTYLFTAARNRAVNHLRRERVARRWEGSVVGRMETPGESGESELLEMLDLQDGIERLPARCRPIFRMSRQQGMTYCQIAESLGLSI